MQKNTNVYTIIDIPHFQDARGIVCFIEENIDIPFSIKRIYYINSVPDNAQRAGHAHKSLYQILIALAGSFTLSLDNGINNERITLSSNLEGILIKPGTWIETLNFTSGTICLALASDHYDSTEYIRTYTEFLQYTNKSNSKDNKTFIPFADIGATYRDHRFQLDQAFTRVMESGNYLSGKELSLFENKFSEYCGTKHCIGVRSGLDALTIIIRALDIGPDDEVIVPAFTFIATWHAVSLTGARPVPVDVSPESFNIDPSLIESAITSKTKAIIAVHIFGLPAEMETIRSIADKHGIHVIEDSAQAHGAKFYDKSVGSLSIASAFSFYPAKNLGAFSDAGAITTDNTELARKIRMISNYGSEQKYNHEIIGCNSRLDELQAAFLSIKLETLVDYNDRRNKIASIYFNQLGNLPLMKQSIPLYMTSTYHQFAILTEQRNSLKSHLENCGIQTMIHYPAPPHLSNAYHSYGYKKGDFPVSEYICESILSLPIGSHIDDTSALYITKTIHDFFSLAIPK